MPFTASELEQRAAPFEGPSMSVPVGPTPKAKKAWKHASKAGLHPGAQ